MRLILIYLLVFYGVNSFSQNANAQLSAANDAELNFEPMLALETTQSNSNSEEVNYNDVITNSDIFSRGENNYKPAEISLSSKEIGASKYCWPGNEYVYKDYIKYKPNKNSTSYEIQEEPMKEKCLEAIYFEARKIGLVLESEPSLQPILFSELKKMIEKIEPAFCKCNNEDENGNPLSIPKEERIASCQLIIDAYKEAEILLSSPEYTTEFHMKLEKLKKKQCKSDEKKYSRISNFQKDYNSLVKINKLSISILKESAISSKQNAR